MKKVFAGLMTIILLAVPTTMSAAGVRGDNDNEFDWTPYINAIALVESGGNPSSRCGIYVGLLAISPVLVTECNNILKSRGESRRYTLNDRLSAEKSKEMFLIFQSRHNPENHIEKGIRMWNGGNRWQTERTRRYYNKVMARVKL